MTEGTNQPARETVSVIRDAPAAVWRLEIGSAVESFTTRLREGEARVLGSASGCAIRIDDPAVSGRHAEIAVRKGRLVVEDLGSRNGLVTGGARVKRAELHGASFFVVGHSIVSCAPAGLEEEDDTAHEPPIDGIIGRSPPMRRLAHDIRRVAPLRAPVLVRGETGTGKELVAEALHRLSPRASRPFVALNMGALPGELADAELFGHERGAFTGAIATRPGAFEQARGGTLFLDEVAELPMPAQAKLLRALENGEVRTLGAATAKKIDVRVVSATWAPIDARVILGHFREDLFHRLAVLTLRVPPLRDRRGDIPLLARVLLDRIAGEVGKHDLTTAAVAQLAQYKWPGNVRELRNVLLRAAVIAKHGLIEADHVTRAIAVGRPQRDVPLASSSDRRKEALATLAACDGNVSKAAAMMGIARSTLRAWVK